MLLLFLNAVLILFYVFIGLPVTAMSGSAEMPKDPLSGNYTEGTVVKHVFDNGFTLLVKPTHNTFQNVAVELWIQAGAKDEISDQKGVAHLLEHMFDIGTKSLVHSELLLTYNAVTGHDYTRVYFHLPIEYWSQSIPVLADIFTKCHFDSKAFNNELKTVANELRMYDDDHWRQLAQLLLSNVFSDHPYGHPIAGYNHDLWHLRAEDAAAFYHEHYIPNNAFMVIVGDVGVDRAIAHVEEYFSHIPAVRDYKKQSFHTSNELMKATVVLYRNVRLFRAMVGFKIPGFTKNNLYVIDILDEILTGSRSARLQQKLIGTYDVVSQLSSSIFGLQESDIYVFLFETFDEEMINNVINVIFAELDHIRNHGCSEKELTRARAHYEVDYYRKLELNNNQAYYTGLFYANGYDEKTPFNMETHNATALNKEIMHFVNTFLKPDSAYISLVQPLPFGEKDLLEQLQQDRMGEDANLIQGRSFESHVDESALDKVYISHKVERTYPSPHTYYLANGIKVLLYKNDIVPTVSIGVWFKADHTYEPVKQPGLFALLRLMMLNSGTTNKTRGELHASLDNFGAEYELAIWQLDSYCMGKDIGEVIAILSEWFTEITFDEHTLAYVKHLLNLEWSGFFDNQRLVLFDLYRNLVFGKNVLGRLQLPDPTYLQNVTLDEIYKGYSEFISPDGLSISIVGDYGDDERLIRLLDNTFGRWTGRTISEQQKFIINSPHARRVTIHSNHEQVFLLLGGKSVTLDDPRLLPLKLYDAGLENRLYKLRERSGLFYFFESNIVHEITKNAPATYYVHIAIAPADIQEATQELIDFIQKDIEHFDEDMLDNARRTLAYRYDQFYGSNQKLKDTFLLLNRYALPFDYYQNQIEHLQEITLAMVKEAAHALLDEDYMLRVLVGPVGPPDGCQEQDSPLIFMQGGVCVA